MFTFTFFFYLLALIGVHPVEYCRNEYPVYFRSIPRGEFAVC